MYGQPPPQHTGSAIAVTTRYHWLAFVLGLLRPFVAVNGHRVPARWGRTVIPVPPGQHHLHVHVPYFLPPQVGTADTVVPVQPGQVVEVEYRAPLIAWLDGAIGPAPQPFRGLPAAVALTVVPLVLLLCVCGGVGLALVSDDRDERPVVLPTREIPPPPDPTLPRTADPEPSQGSTGKPALRRTSPRTLVGPAFGDGEATYTMAFEGWPFAFRTPRTWGCVAGKVDLPDAKAWVCIDEGNAGNGQRVQIMLRSCPDICGQTVRNTLNDDWFDAGATPRRRGLDTYYVEKADAQGRYALDVSHFFPASSGPKWQVGVGVTSPPATRADVQKIVNDILTQAG